LRFRVKIFQQRGTLSIAIRAIPFNILSCYLLNLPRVMEKIANEERGLVIVTGTTGSGKSNTLAALVDYINKNKARHIITVEDPLEYVHEYASSYINQERDRHRHVVVRERYEGGVERSPRRNTRRRDEGPRIDGNMFVRG
jgi:twitching motility protein PilT